MLESVTSEIALARLALDLGGGGVGGPLSEAERELAAAGLAAAPSTDRVVLETHEAIRDGGDPLGEVFCRLRPPVRRRAAGAYYTPPELVGPMTSWVLERHPDRVVDAGSGSGRFSAAINRATRSTQIVAVDADPLATLMTRAVLASLCVSRAQVLNADFTVLALPRISGRTAYVGNPPYVRHHDLRPERKAWSVATALRLGHRAATFSLAGLHAHFFVAVAANAAPDDIGCFVTSSEWLDVGYGAVIRGLLLNGLGGEAIHIVSPTAVPFEDAMTTAVISCFVVGTAPKGIRMRLVDSPVELGGLCEGRLISRDVLARVGKWSSLVRPTVAAEETGVVLLLALARVHRGVATGANDFFVVTRDQARRLGIERWCRPAITSGREVLQSDGVIRDGPERKLVVSFPSDVDRGALPEIDHYLAEGERKGIPSRFIPSHRHPWWRLGLGSPPPMVLSYMARQAPRFAANPDGLVNLNVVHGLYPHLGLSIAESVALADMLNAVRERFRGAGRTYHGGMEKFEPKEAEALEVPAALLPQRLQVQLCLDI